MKKLLSAVLVSALALSMSTVAFAADNQDASFTKTYKITNEGTQSPEESFTFKFTADKVTDSNKDLKVEDMPAIENADVSFSAGDATAAGLEKQVDVALSEIEWPGVGVYYYKVNELAGQTAGVKYDDATAYLKVTVAYDEGTHTYYTAFVTLNLEQGDDGQTLVKTGGFTNEYSAGVLKIKKNVTGNMGDKSAYFAVDVTLMGEDDYTYEPSYEVTGGSNEDNPTSVAIGQKATFYLKDDETITINNLPYGVSYTVEEADYTPAAMGGYDEASYEFSDKEKTIDSAADMVTITNNKSVEVDTGIFTDSMPYIVMIGIVCAGLVVFALRRRASK